MVLDIVIAIIILFMMVFGFRHGFIYTFINMTSWIISIVGAFALSPIVYKFLFNKTGLHDLMYENLYIKFTSAMHTEDLSFSSLPSVVSDTADLITKGVAENMAQSLADLLFSLFSFILVIFAIKLVLFVITKLFSRNRDIGFVGAVDGLVGLAFGFIKGMLLVFVLLAVMVPFSAMAGPSITQSIMDTLDSSYIANELYNNNFVLLVFNNL